MDWLGGLTDKILDAFTSGGEAVGEAVVGGATDAFNALWEGLVTRLFVMWFSVQTAMTDLMLQFVARVMLEGGDTLSSCGETGFSTTCLGSDWFLHAYEGSIRVGAVLAFFAICVGVIAGVFQHFSSGQPEPSAVMRVLLGMPKLALTWAVIVAMTAYSVSMFDALAIWWADWAAGSGALVPTKTPIEDVVGLLDNITGASKGSAPHTDMSLLTGAMASVILVPSMIAKMLVMTVVYLLMTIALFMIGVILVVRSVMIQIVLILAPLVSVTLLTKWAGTAKMLMTKLFGLILIKPVIVVILGLGSAILSGSGTGGGVSLFQPDAFLAAVLEDGYDGMFALMGTLIVGLVTLFVAAMSPTMVMSLVEPQDGGGALAGSAPGRAGGKAMQYGYYGRTFTPQKGGALRTKLKGMRSGAGR